MIGFSLFFIFLQKNFQLFQTISKILGEKAIIFQKIKHLRYGSLKTRFLHKNS